MADISSRCVLMKGLSHDATEQDLMKCLDNQNFSVSKVHSHIESRKDKRWVVLFFSSEAARECIRRGSWKVQLPSGEITVTPDYCSECIVPDDWIEKHDSDEESLDESWFKVETPASKQLHALSESVYSNSSEEPRETPVCGAVDQKEKLLQLAAIDDSVENFSEEINYFAQFPQDKPRSEKMRTEKATGGKGYHINSDPDKSPDLPGSFYSCSIEESHVMLVHGADGQNANVSTQQKLLHMATEEDTDENFPKAVNQHARFPQDRPQSEEMRPKASDGEKENSTDSDPDEMCQAAYVQGMSSQSELLIPESPKIIDDSTDYPPLKSGSIAMGTARLKYTTDTSHTDSPEDVTKHRDHDRIQTKTTYQKQGPINLTGRRGPQSLNTSSVKEEVCKQDRDSQENKECGHEKWHLPPIDSKENVASDEDEEGQTNVCHSPDIEDLNHAMRELNKKDEHVNSQPQKRDVAWSHENPSVHNERLLEPLRTLVMDKTIKTEVLQPCTGISAQGSAMPEPQAIIEGYPLNLTMPHPSQGVPSQDMTMATSYMKMPQPYADVSFQGLTVSQPNTDNQLPNMGMPQPITGLPIQSLHITPVTSLPINSPYIAGPVYSVVTTGQATVSGGTGNYMVPPGYAGHNFYNSCQTMPSIPPFRPQMNYGPYGWLHQSPPFIQQHVSATFSQPSHPTSQASFMYRMQSLRPPIGCPPTQEGFSELIGARDNAGQMASQTGPVQGNLGCVNKTGRPQTITNAEIIQQTNTSDRFERVTVEQDLEMRERDEFELNEDKPQSQLSPKLSENQFQFNKESLEIKGHPDRVNLIDSQRISHDHRYDVLEGFESDKEAASNAHMDHAEKDAEKIESKPQKENVQTPRIIRVMGFTKSISQDTLEMFFENKKRCGGGEIENLEWGRNKREVFITFKDSSVVQSVLEKQKSEPFHLEQLKLTVEEYVPLPPDPLRLFLTNLSPRVTQELLILYLEPRCNATPAKIVFGRVQGAALVTFSEPPDVELLLKKVKERPLEGQNIQVVRVPITSSIQLSGLPLSATRDTIELYFENAKRSGGGPVADVKHTKDKKSCIVSFKNSEDAERVCMRPHTIDKKEIQVCLYYECLDDDLDAEEFSDLIHESEDTGDELKLPDPIKLNNWNPPILRFVIKNTKHRNMFEKNLSDLNGVAKWPSSAEGYVIIECTVKVEDKNASSLLKDWTTRVISDVKKFITGIEVAEFNLIQTAWPRVLEGLRTVTIDNPEDVGVFVEEVKHNIAVVGPRAIVEELKKTIKQMIVMVETQIALENNTVRETKKLKTFEIALLRMSHFNQEIQKMHPELQFDLDQKERMAIFVGQADIVQKAMVQMHEKLNSFVSRSMQISKAAQDLLFTKETRKYIKQKMFSQKIVGVWDVVRHDEVLMYGQDKKEVGRAIQLVKACLVENNIPLDETMAQAFQGQQWTQLVQSILKKHTGKCAVEPDIKGILVVAVDDIFQDVFDEIKVYLEKHFVEELFLALDPTRVKFIGRYKNEDIKALEKKFESSHVKLSIIDYGDKKGIKINGTRDVCCKVKTDLAKMANTVITKEHRMVNYKEGLKEFLQGYKAKKQLITIENSFKCFMVIKDLGTSSSLQQKVSKTPVEETKFRSGSKQSILVFNITADSDYNIQAAVKELEGFLSKELFM
ncbi:hypothetical protein CHS0354_014196 [Potamilus streckersoni]|uniref:RRM domain-containing protein n=1 Tax=Potamilus streckersoni TaxID=2493646 RepID=A0AAE0T055_9BIVA|nr:hypothetical protein CHS0354_014196 [Potamilus streckersoni]